MPARQRVVTKPRRRDVKPRRSGSLSATTDPLDQAAPEPHARDRDKPVAAIAAAGAVRHSAT